MTRRLPVLGLLALLAAGCSSGSPEAVDVTPPASESSTATVPGTVPASLPPATEAPTTAPPAPEPEDEGPPVVLREDGLTDTLRFGVKPDEVIAGLTLRWGPPEGDTGWIPSDGPSQPFGNGCPGPNVRGVSWGRFSVLFTDGTSPHAAGKPHFFSWLYLADNPADPRPDPGGNRPTLRTAAGISVAATVDELRAAYGDGLNLYDETTEEGLATGGPGFSAAGMFGSLTSLEPGGRVNRIVGGGGCG